MINVFLVKGVNYHFLVSEAIIALGKWVKYVAKLSHTPPPSYEATINLNPPPHIMIILMVSRPPPHPPRPPLKKRLLSLIPSYLVYLLDFFLRYKHHFKWLFDVCRRVIWRVIRITGLSELVSSLYELGNSPSSAAWSLALGFPHAWVRTQEFLSDWTFSWSSI